MTNSQKLLFVGADLSGIQRFLYNITSYKAAVSLRGRSQYLVDYIDRLHDGILTSPTLHAYTGYGVQEGEVYHSGGKLYLIIEDTLEARTTLEKLQHEAEKEMWDKHHGALGIIICYIPFSFEDESRVSFPDGEQGNLGMLWRKASEEFARGKARKFEDYAKENYEEFFVPQPISDRMRVCALTGIESIDCVPLGDGERYVLPSVMEQIDLGKRIQKEQGFRTFEEYAGDSWLGILRMDVDGLGSLFAQGFKSIEEYRTFSNRLQSFFATRLEEIAARYSQYLTVLYAGGDDMFVVGRWDRVADFAAEARNAFVAYINRPGITISGGMVVVSPKFPIAKAAELAGEAEDEAKRFRSGEKNAFCILGQCISWDKEYDYVYNWRNRMVDMCTAGELPRSILHKLMLFDEMRRRGEVSYLWNAAYYLSRFRKDKKSEEVTSFCDEVQRDYFSTTDSSRKTELLALSARWAELKMRNNKQ